MDIPQLLQTTMEGLLQHLQITSFTVTIRPEKDDAFLIHIDAEDSALLIGRHGAGIAALQQVMYVMMRKHFDEEHMPKIRVDVGNYKEHYEQKLLAYVDKKVEHVLKEDVRETLHPMNSYHRRMAHLYIAEKYPDIATESIGNPPLKRLTIRKKLSASDDLLSELP